ncbi:hypothetical protein BSKO_12047 [Bryopsis sp. KO-2023]|nr:hypothetical protein BSKO_12047 [Bryopsis sp. KO-2023]
MKLPEHYVLGVGVVKPTGKGGFGQKLLEKMGWKDGEGLGKNKTGISEAIELKFKDDKDGVGKKTAYDWKVPFWENAYESGLKNVGKGGSESSTSTQANGASSSSSDSESDSDSDSKIVPSKKRKSNFNMDGTVTTARSSELEIFNFLSKGRTGRWGGREAKLARIREQEQSLANEARKKLGLSVVPIDPPPQNETQENGGPHSTKSEKKTKKQKTIEGENGGGGALKSKKKKSKKVVSVEEPDVAKKLKRKKEKKTDGPLDDGEEEKNSRVGGKKYSRKKEKSRKKKSVDSSNADTKNSEKKRKRKRKEDDMVLDKSAEECLEGSDGPSIRKKRKKSSKKSKHQENAPEEIPGSPPRLKSKKEKKKGKKSEKKKKAGRKVIEVKTRKVELPERTPTSGWWGAKRFVSAGFAGEVKEVVPTDWLERQAFDEDDQVKAYMFAHNAKRKGTGGLGC